MSAPAVTLCSDLSLPFLATFDELAPGRIAPARLLGTFVWKQLWDGGIANHRPERVLLDSLPGRAYLAYRSRGLRSRLRRWRGGMIVQRSRNYAHLTAGILPLLRNPFELLANQDSGTPEVFRLSHLVPGRSRPWRAAWVRELYRVAREGLGEYRDRVPESSAWFEQLLGVAQDMLDAAFVFWEESRAPGGVIFSNEGLADLALSQAGLRLGRRLVKLQHGYYYDLVLYYPRIADVVCTWDRWVRRRYRLRSAGAQPAEVVGPFHLQGLPPPGPRPPGPPELLFMGSVETDAVLARHEPALRALAGDGTRWRATWRPHPRDRTPPERIERMGFRLDREGTPYVRMRDAGVVASFWSSTLAEARMLGTPALCVAPSQDRWLREWVASTGTPAVTTAEEASVAVATLLASGPPVLGEIPDPAEACRRAAARIDRALVGEDPRGASR